MLKTLRALRQEAYLTQQMLGEAIGVSSMTVLRWEQGQRPLMRHLHKLAAYFHLSVAEMAKIIDNGATVDEEVTALAS